MRPPRSRRAMPEGLRRGGGMTGGGGALAPGAQPAYLVVEDGRAGALDHRLGAVAGEGPQALALAAGDDQSVHRQFAAGFLRLAWAPDPPPSRSPDSFADGVMASGERSRRS